MSRRIAWRGDARVFTKYQLHAAWLQGCLYGAMRKGQRPIYHQLASQFDEGIKAVADGWVNITDEAGMRQLIRECLAGFPYSRAHTVLRERARLMESGALISELCS